MLAPIPLAGQVVQIGPGEATNQPTRQEPFMRSPAGDRGFDRLHIDTSRGGSADVAWGFFVPALVSRRNKLTAP